MDVTKTAQLSITSDTSSFASVQNGVVQGLRVGTAVLQAVYGNTSVTANVYVTANSDSSSTTSPGGSTGGPAGGSTGSTSSSAVQVTAGSDGKVDATALANAFASSTSVQVNISGDKAQLPASALLDAAGKSGAAVTIVSDKGTYTLPLSVLKLDALAKALGVDVKDLTIVVSITKASGDAVTGIANAAAALGGNTIADAIDFNVTAAGKDGKSISVGFGTTYVSRTLNATKAIDGKKATGALYNETTKKLSFVPSTFDGKVATLKRNGNSIYTVVENNKSFDDLANHWAKADVELLANKLVVEGVSDKKFDADRNISRAEFAALVVRSLGLTSVSTDSKFKDVKAGAWYADSVSTAVYAGIINGYEDNTFRPDAQITREELAAMVVRALNYAGVKSDVNAIQAANVLAKFKDANKIVWAQNEIAAAVQAGIINGLTDDTIGSANQATRAQSATMLKRFLSAANFIN
ncbi:S-layer homology domain-containing protein [Paenibacillus filicis]|uniref:S-layer homology domain-containing protein n=1 Tax=Paenibacillus gyeongsangnamensis TaxID=3388067 RepID=A0ABT4Q6P0_9BACL|nr:S-layer homology domain-containing protein [Paenibacillus filicis]MCZ8512539.1 S-layer homology domain-containing protein [Paenibacillus filicis]